jgi:hypothetical protein
MAHGARLKAREGGKAHSVKGIAQKVEGGGGINVKANRRISNVEGWLRSRSASVGAAGCSVFL